MFRKLFPVLALAVILTACLESSPVSTTVSVKASSYSSTGKTSASGRVETSSVAITDFKVNISNIKFELDEDDDRYDKSPIYEDTKLTGPFLLDLLNPDQTLDQLIASVDLPSGTYEKMEVKFDNSTDSGELNGKTFALKGTIDGKEFILWSDEDAELEVDFENTDDDIAAGGGEIIVNIKIQIDALLARIVQLAKDGALKDVDGDGLIEITTKGDDNSSSIAKEFKKLLEDDCHLDDKD